VNPPPKQKGHPASNKWCDYAASAPTVVCHRRRGLADMYVVSARAEGVSILTLMGLKVQDAAQNTSPVLPERRIIFGTSCSMIEAALERKANLSPKLKRHAQFERVVRPCCFSSHGCALRAWCERRRKRAERIIYPCGQGLCGGHQPLVASDPSTSLHWQVGSAQSQVSSADYVTRASEPRCCCPPARDAHDLTHCVSA